MSSLAFLVLNAILPDVLSTLLLQELELLKKMLSSTGLSTGLNRLEWLESRESSHTEIDAYN